MNLLQFVEMHRGESILLCLLCIFVVTSFSSVGAFFIRDKNQFMLQTVLGIGFVGALLVVAVSFSAVFAKYIIYVSIFLSVILLIKKFVMKELKILDYVNKLKFTVCLYGIFLLILFIYIFKNIGSVDYNAHTAYMFAIPNEIFKADYFSRIRIYDVYPFEWSKYHMFNGCSSAVALAVFPLKNIVSYNMAKYAVISCFIGCIYEQILSRNGKSKSLKIFVFGASLLCICCWKLVRWSLFMNNYSSLFTMGILFFLLLKKDFKSGVFFSLLLMLVTSKSTITGFVLFLYCCYMLNQEHFILKSSVYEKLSVLSFLIIFCGATGTMFITGGTPLQEGMFNPRFMENLKSSWGDLLPFYGSLESFRNSRNLKSLISSDMFLLPFYFAILKLNMKKIFCFLSKNRNIVLSFGFLLLGIYGSYWIGKYGGIVIKASLFYLPVFIFAVYVLPLIIFGVLCEDEFMTPFKFFILLSAVQYMILRSDNAACNLSLIFVPLFYYVSELSVDKIFSRAGKYRMIPVYAGVVFAVINVSFTDPFYPFFLTRKDFYQSVIKLREVEYLEYGMCYEIESSEDLETAMLNAFKGNRIHYNVSMPNDMALKTSMTQRFIPKD